MPEDRVFDVSKPGQVSPHATSKPVIVGHHPLMNDPMVRGDDKPEPTHINVLGAHEEGIKPEEPLFHAEKPAEEPVASPPLEAAIAPAAVLPDPAINPEITYDEPVPGAKPPPPPAEPGEQAAEPAEHPPEHAVDHVEGLHVGGSKRRRNPLGWLLLLILILLVAAYLLIDAGVIHTSLNLPFHVFKQKTPASPPASAPASNNQPSGPTIPAGFTQYRIAGTSITFAAPTTWGTPTSSSEQGYTIRGGTNKPDGTYAYLVDFPANKGVEIAVTSSQYLPPVRSVPLYYDYLQWCTGTNDGKVYLSILHFTTANKVDTPATVSCDQGPLADATKLDSTTIVELKAKNAAGQLLGDLYTMNLQNTNLPVFRVKDAKSAYGADIKQMLATVQEPAQTSATSNSSTSSSGSSSSSSP